MKPISIGFLFHMQKQTCFHHFITGLFSTVVQINKPFLLSYLQVNMPELALLRFVVLDDDYIGDDFIGQYTVAFECLQPGYRNVPLLGLTGEPLPHTSVFVHVAVTNRRGGGKAQRRGLSVRRVGRRGREYVTLRHTGIKVVDEAFKPAGCLLKEATDLREEAQVRGQPVSTRFE